MVSSEAPSPLVTEHGRTRIADTVVEKVAAVAAREVPGVHRLGSGAARALGSLRERIPGQRVALGQGVAVEVGERQTAVDLDVVVDYGYPIATVATQVRQNVIAAVQQLVGLEVTEVNISVNDVHLPDDTDDDDDEPEARVQ
ncbi:MAG TPA: Asp23/Gls24 family envelope stress response protein [Acidimicrobiales bacterium]